MNTAPPKEDPPTKKIKVDCELTEVDEINDPDLNPWGAEELTYNGAPVCGDNEKCEKCNVWKDYVEDDVYLCFKCLDDGPEPDDESFNPEDEEPSDPDEEEDEEDDILPESDSIGYCEKCKKSHDWCTIEEHFYHSSYNWSKIDVQNCRPPLHIIQFGKHRMNRDYRQGLYNLCIDFTTEEIVGFFLGVSSNFPSFEKWIQNGKKAQLDDEKEYEERCEQVREYLDASDTSPKIILPETDAIGYCKRCQKSHDWSTVQLNGLGSGRLMGCRPPIHIIQFGRYRINHTYRQALAQQKPRFGTEEIMRTILGQFGGFSGYKKWMLERYGTNWAEVP